MTAAEAVALIPERASILMGGFGLCGIPENLIKALAMQGTGNLTVMSNNAGVDDYGIGLLLQNRQVRKMIGTYVGENDLLETMILEKQIEIELIPQGTFAERVRAHGAGIPAFFTPTGVGTVVADGKEVRDFDGREYVLERSLGADFAFVKAYKADRLGNLVYRRTTRNFNPMMATAGKTTIAEVEEIVDVGELDPEAITTPGIYVDILVRGEVYEKRIEKRTHR
ncbi:MAG: CoA transferase subunit A [Candidatus Latescibacterota bacterium]|nr:MAG: CoA transferase subunit A [Candidatus Latescibacterota bacterium]